MRAVLTTLAEQAGVALDRVRTLERRRAAEEELKASHRYISELTALVPGVFYVFDLDKQRNVFVNRHPAEVSVMATARSPECETTSSPRSCTPTTGPRSSDTSTRSAFWTTVAPRPPNTGFRHRDGNWPASKALTRFSPEESDGRARQILGIAMDVTERSEAVQRLHEYAERSAFRAELIAALRPIDDPLEMQRVSEPAHRRAAGRRPRAPRRRVGNNAHVEAEYFSDGVASVAGTIVLTTYGVSLVNEVRRAKRLSSATVAHDPRLGPAERAVTVGLGIGAYVGVPLMRGDEMVGFSASPLRTTGMDR